VVELVPIVECSSFPMIRSVKQQSFAHTLLTILLHPKSNPIFITKIGLWSAKFPTLKCDLQVTERA